jgi:hypothetical protein
MRTASFIGALGVLLALTPRAFAEWYDRPMAVASGKGVFSDLDRRPGAPLRKGDLWRTVAAIPGAIVPPAPAHPGAPATIGDLHRAFVRALDLPDTAAGVTAGLRAAGLDPPRGAGSDIVARTLGLHYNRPPRRDYQEPRSRDVATRSDAAYALWKVLRQDGSEVPYVREKLWALWLPASGNGRRRVLQAAVEQIGEPYVWGGESRAEGGFDCSGLVVYSLGDDPWLHGRTTFDMSRVPRSERVPIGALAPGDLVFFGDRGPNSKPRQVDHMGIYLGNGWMIHSGGQGVVLDRIDAPWWAPRAAWGRRPPRI